jgi:hypothetical protein
MAYDVRTVTFCVLLELTLNVQANMIHSGNEHPCRANDNPRQNGKSSNVPSFLISTEVADKVSAQREAEAEKEKLKGF